MTTKPTRPSIDWEAIEREYRAGQLSVAEIGRTHGVSHTAINKRAKAKRWTRDLAQRVRQEVAARLVSDEVSAASETETVETAAARGVELIRQHRADLAQLHGLLRTVMGRVAVHLDGGKLDGPALGEKETVLDAIEKGSRILARTIPLERQAFSLDDAKKGEGSSLADLIAASYRHGEEAKPGVTG